MPGIGAVVFARLTGTPAVTAIIGSGDAARLYPDDEVPDEPGGSYGAYRVNDDVPDKDLKGRITGYDAEVTVSLFTPSYAQAWTLLKACRAALDGMAGTIAGITVIGSEIESSSDEPGEQETEDDAKFYQVDVTVSIQYV